MIKKQIERFLRWYLSEPIAPLIVGFIGAVVGVVIGLALKPVIGG